MSDRIKYEWLQLFNYLAEARGRKRERAIHVWTLASISTLYHSEPKFATTGRFSKTERERAMRCLCESDGMVPTELFHLSRRSQEKPKSPSNLFLLDRKWDTFGTAPGSVPLFCPPPRGVLEPPRASGPDPNLSTPPFSRERERGKIQKKETERKLLLACFLAKIKSLKSEMNYQSNICRIRVALSFSLSICSFLSFFSLFLT